jgi:copper chaperone CopZ
MTDQEWKIGGMTCHHCVMVVRKELSKVQGLEIKNVEIGSALVAYGDGRVSPDQIQHAIQEAGYQVLHHS